MAASTHINRCFSIASLAAIATASISLSAAPITSEIANRASGRVDQDEVAYRGSGRLDNGYGLLAYRASGRFSQGLDLAYRGSERGIQAA